MLLLLAGGGPQAAPPSSTPGKSLMFWGCGNVFAALALGTAMILAAL